MRSARHLPQAVRVRPAGRDAQGLVGVRQSEGEADRLAADLGEDQQFGAQDGLELRGHVRRLAFGHRYETRLSTQALL
ncbi:hypothetical protein AB0K14_38235 [Actinosynnema sp. NPDC050801]|uniref:hypothetical protein n=1 Tax=unclassified Actinosynnema TaxID=2637065 RepID=UPI003404275C